MVRWLWSQILTGYSYKSSQYGLTIDNIVKYELVLPNGTIKHVTEKDNDLWFGLRVSKGCSIQVGITNGI